MVGDKRINIYCLKGGKRKTTTASYNRFLMIAKMFSINYNCKIIGFDKEGSIKYDRNKITNNLVRRFRILRAAFQVPKSTTNRVNIIFLGSTDPYIALIIWIIAKIKKLKIINERNEYPIAIRNNIKWKGFLYKMTVLWWHYRLFDGMFLMTEALINFYSPYTNKHCVIQKLPMSVDFSRFESNESLKGNEYIAYTGSLSNEKDGVLYLIHAFKKISELFPELRLKIAGGKKDEVAVLRKNIEDLDLNNRIQLMGLIDRTEIPQLLTNAKVLVLPRPDSKQAQGGFPTKLGEYLATSKPVIVSGVGEIPSYLLNNEVYFIDSAKIETDLVKALSYILNNYNEATKMGIRGQSKAKKEFSIEANANRTSVLVMQVADN